MASISRAVTEVLGLRKVYIAETRVRSHARLPLIAFISLECNGHIKIGVTSMPIEKRFGTLSTGSAGKMTVLATIEISCEARMVHSGTRNSRLHRGHQDQAAAMTVRRFRPTWSVEEQAACFIVRDSSGHRVLLLRGRAWSAISGGRSSERSAISFL